MKALDRLEEMINLPFDQIIMYIKNGRITAGKYSNLTKNKDLKSIKELIKNVSNNK